MGGSAWVRATAARRVLSATTTCNTKQDETVNTHRARDFGLETGPSHRSTATCSCHGPQTPSGTDWQVKSPVREGIPKAWGVVCVAYLAGVTGNENVFTYKICNNRCLFKIIFCLETGLNLGPGPQRPGKATPPFLGQSVPERPLNHSLETEFQL